MPLLAYLTENATWARSFRYRDFRLLWGSTLLHSLGFGMEQVAVGWLVLDMTGSTFMVGVAAAARMAPFFFLGIISGAVADRVDRRLLLRYITLGGMIAAGLMAFLLLTGVEQVWYVIALVAAMGCVFAFMMTTRQAYTYDIVGPENALNGLALTGISMQFGGIAGSLIAGGLIDTLGAGWQYVAVGASYVAAVAVLMAMRDVGRAVVTQRESVWRNLVGYVQLIQSNRILLIIMCLAATTEVFGFTHMTLLPVFAKNVLHVGAVGLGLMTAVRQGGGILGLTLLASFGTYRRKGLLMFAMAIAFGLGQIAFSISSNLLFFLGVLVIINACAMSVDTLYKVLMQENVPDEQRGRAMGSWVLSIGVAPVGHLSIGGLASLLGAPGALLINGAILTFVSVATAIGLPKIRRLE